MSELADLDWHPEDSVLVIDCPRALGEGEPLDEWQMGFANLVARRLSEYMTVQVLGGRLEVQTSRDPDHMVWLLFLMADSHGQVGITRKGIDEAKYNVADYVANRLFHHATADAIHKTLGRNGCLG